MAGISKNTKNSTGNKVSGAIKYALSNDCEICATPCERGKNYLKVFNIRHWGNGVPCKIKK